MAPGAGPGGELLLIGELLVDEFADGAVPGGAPLNVACALAALGERPLLLGRLGHGQGADAAAATLLRQQIARFGLDTAGLQRDTRRPTGRVLFEQPEGGGEHRFVIAPDAAWDALAFSPIVRLLATRPPPRLLYFGTLAQRSAGGRATLQGLLRQLPRPGCLRYLDLNLRAGVDDLRALSLASLVEADWLKLNEAELAAVLDWCGLQTPAALIARFGLQRLVLTRGDRGYAVYEATGQRAIGAAVDPAQPLVDTVGAGDAFSAMLLAASLRGWAIAAAADLANRFAAAICGQRGALAPDPGFYAPWRAALQQPQPVCG